MNEESVNPIEPLSQIGKYEIIEHIATGGMGVVYKARDRKLDRLVALKLLPADLAKQKTTLIRFEREAKAAAHLKHENIVAIYDVDEEAGTHFIAFEFIEGIDLQDYIDRKCKIDPEEGRQIMIQAARALAHAHEQGIVHRDIKPSNFLLLQKGKRIVVKLSDFGLAIRNESNEEYRITRDKTTVGTVDYMSPEQARDSRSADIRSDIYSLGCTFYHMLAGSAPFARGSLPERIMHHIRSAPPDIRKFNTGVSESIVAILQRMLAKKPEDRYQTPTELLADLENPDSVIADKRGLLVGKLDEAGKRRSKHDLTQVIDRNDGETPDIDTKPLKLPRPKKTSSDANEDDVEELEKPARSERKEKAKRETDSAPQRTGRAKSPRGSQFWLLSVGTVLCLLVSILFGAIMFGNRPARDVKDDRPDPPTEQPPLQVKVEKPPEKTIPPPPVVVIDTSPSKMTVAAPVFPIMDRTPDKKNRETLNKEFAGPFAEFPIVPKDARVVKVSRLAAVGEQVFRTLGDALADAKADMVNVIEIHDAGPIHVSSLPALAKRTIWLRAGEGFRPLLVWDAPPRTINAKTQAVFLDLADGMLVIDRIDFAMQSSGELPATIFHLPGTSVYLRDATFSVAGASIRGVTLIRRDASKEKPNSRRTQTWLQQCSIRGADTALYDHADASGDLLMQDCLYAGYKHPVFRLRSREGCAFGLRFIRSTMVTGHSWLRWESTQSKREVPEIDVHLLDTIVSRDDTTTAQGDLLQLVEAIDLSKIAWHAENSAYAGWKNLVSSRFKTLSALELSAWRTLWKVESGDRSFAETWPAIPPPDVHRAPLDIFAPCPGAERDPVAFAALTGPGAIGAVVGHLSPTAASGGQRAFEPPTMPVVARADPDPIFKEPENDGLYHGERLDLTKVDLGAHLTALFKQPDFRPAPRVVVFLTGRGVCPTSPVIASSVPNLIFVVEPTKDPKDALVLEAKPMPVIQQSAMFDVTRGNLELFGVHVRLNSTTVAPAIVQVRQGHLSLTRCHLEGPLGGSSSALQHLVAMATQGSIPAMLTLRDNYLAASKPIALLNNQVQLRARGNVIAAIGDGFVFDTPNGTTNLDHLLDHNTIVLKQNLVVVKSNAKRRDGKTTFFANSNAILAPFADDAGKTTLLRGVESVVASARWTWQGRHNIYDSRLHAYFAALDSKPSAKQQLGDWRTAWGPVAEQGSMLYDTKTTTKLYTLDAITHADLLRQLDRLILPKVLRGDPTQSPPGADLVAVGVSKKKG